MLQKLDDPEKTTVGDIHEKYPDNWFRYGVMENGDVYAVYIADSQEELLTVTETQMEADGFFDWGDIYPRGLNTARQVEINYGWNS